MLKTGTMPEEGRGLIERLDKATAAMVALEDEVETLKHRLDNGDIAAIHLGVRRIVEALLRHANRAEGSSCQRMARFSRSETLCARRPRTG
jgi:hypothetical protein